MKSEDAALLSVLFVAFYVFPAFCLTAQMVKERFDHAVRGDPPSWWVKDDLTCFVVGLAMSVSYFIFYLVFAIPLLLYNCHSFLYMSLGRRPPACMQYGCWRWAYPGETNSGSNREGVNVYTPKHCGSQAGQRNGSWSRILSKRDPDIESKPPMATLSSRSGLQQNKGIDLGYAGMLEMSLPTSSLATIPESSETTSSDDRPPSY